MNKRKRSESFAHVAKKIRKDILLMSYRANSAHVGGSLSCVEILLALYCGAMNHNPKKPLDTTRDRFVFSKGHDVKALYAVLAHVGYIDHSLLAGYEQNGGVLHGHVTRGDVPGIYYSSGSLGHGLPIACGVAVAGKLRSHSYRVFVLLSDGECNEGTTWESALFAHHHRLDNLVVIIDYNKLQGFGRTEDVLSLEPFAKKWNAFGFRVISVHNGHSVRAILHAFDSVSTRQGKPTVVIVHTTKGQGGVAEHIDKISSQYKPPTTEEIQKMYSQEC